ncbi:MAG: hypothetical protein JNK63_00535 [Chthonomonas sp.]|nr:hypothetical protein [Chthonomonas sp.]
MAQIAPFVITGPAGRAVELTSTIILLAKFAVGLASMITFLRKRAVGLGSMITFHR